MQGVPFLDAEVTKHVAALLVRRRLDHRTPHLGSAWCVPCDGHLQKPAQILGVHADLSSSELSALCQLFVRIVEPAAATLPSDSTTLSTTATRLALVQSRWWHKVIVARVLKQHVHDVFLFSAALVRHARRLRVAQRRTHELASSASFPGLLLLPMPRTDGSIVRHQRTRQRPCLYWHLHH
ncbi:hypothetical protein EDB83DRAFT_2350458 [Lactarius deliciosus]|nr:hypothetical protein EDB83DRAFT_2350458 [Lactarius deliciosus]